MLIAPNETIKVTGIETFVLTNSWVFVKITTDAGITGWGEMLKDDAKACAAGAKEVSHYLVGEDPRPVTHHWQAIHRGAFYRGGPIKTATSSGIDQALWDITGKCYGVPVYKLLGGPTRETVPAYASTTGCSLDPGRVRERSQGLVSDGYTAMKWFFLHGPGSGREGMAKNLELVRTVREAVGDDVDIMFDAWLSWDVPYAVAVGERMAEYRPRWLEEPVSPDRIDSCAAIRRALPFPIASGEHEYTRWGHQDLIRAEAVDVLQPDIYWVGGITETIKICTLASLSEPQLVPHVHSVPATVHLLFSQPPDVCPLLEYLVPVS